MKSVNLKLLAAIIGGGMVLSVFLYLGMVMWSGGVQGFPLDDAWIHQTYARNLVEKGQWSYESGRASAGSTSPLWTLALTPAYLTGIDHRLWAFALGMMTLALTAWLAWRIMTLMFGAPYWLGLSAALFCVLEWHLVWAALSGMETLLFAALALLCIDLYLAFESQVTAQAGDYHRGAEGTEKDKNKKKLRVLRASVVNQVCVTCWAEQLPRVGLPVWMGLSAALLVLTRPEGLLLLALIAICFLWNRIRSGANRNALVWTFVAALVCLTLLTAYVLFNLTTSGFIFPTTFYAKQAEYRSMIESLSIPARFANLLLAVWVGPQILLIPGFLFAIGYSIKRRQVGIALLWVWWLCSIAIYVFRLPVSYQHGRYLIPTIPVFVILGIWGTWRAIRWLGDHIAARVLSRTWIAATAVLLLVFWAIGARAYARDVAFIYGEMGTMAEWLKQNAPPQSRLAVHDIGMVGYTLDRPFIDLAGLVTPEVIPFIDDEERLLDFMESEGVDYVVVFPDWSDAYRRMLRDPRLTLVYSTNYTWTLAAGHDNLSVYRAVW